MDWKLTDDRPIWLQLSEQLARGIISGVYPPGSRLPSVRELAMQAGVNPNTMQRALAQLEQDGLAKAERTAGRIVTEDLQVLEKARLAEAKIKASEYLHGMEQLGYDKAQAVEMLKEETK
ncbi:MAG: GntR family transcriptional regulator [Clostridiales bacterium]|nr:GntR family transcriptional regulator [Clostridiales bacterium]